MRPTGDGGRRRFEARSGSDLIVGYHSPAEPAEGSGPSPAIVLCPGFGATQDTPSVRAAARAFAEAGIHSFTFDYRTFGESGGSPRQILSIPRQLRDIRAVVARVRGMPGIDPDRVALWGSSLGGGHVLRVGALDPRIAAVVAQVPFNGVARRVEGRPTRVALGLLADAVRDRLRGWFGRPPIYVKVTGDADERAVMGSAAAQTAIEAMVSDTWRNEVAPRGLLDMMTYRPGRHVDRIVGRVLICVATGDLEIPAELTADLAARARHGEQRSYDVSHFEIYRPDIRARVLEDQTEFLTRSLRPKLAHRALP